MRTSTNEHRYVCVPCARATVWYRQPLNFWYFSTYMYVYRLRADIPPSCDGRMAARPIGGREANRSPLLIDRDRSEDGRSLGAALLANNEVSTNLLYGNALQYLEISRHRRKKRGQRNKRPCHNQRPSVPCNIINESEVSA